MPHRANPSVFAFFEDHSFLMINCETRLYCLHGGALFQYATGRRMAAKWCARAPLVTPYKERTFNKCVDVMLPR